MSTPDYLAGYLVAVLVSLGYAHTLRSLLSTGDYSPYVGSAAGSAIAGISLYLTASLPLALSAGFAATALVMTLLEEVLAR